MNLNYNDISRIVEDIRYAIQAGGNPFQQGGGIWSRFVFLTVVFKSIIMLCVYIIIIYFIYIIIFKGYPRILFDLVSLAIFKKQNLDRLFSEHQFMINHYYFLQKQRTDFRGLYPFDVFDTLVTPIEDQETQKEIAARRKVEGNRFKDECQTAPGQGVGGDLRNKAEFVETKVNQYYKGFKYVKKYVEAFREFFLYYYKINSASKKEIYLWPQRLENPAAKVPQCPAPKIEQQAFVGINQKPLAPKTIDCPAPKYTIEFYDFYETMCEYQIRTGQIKPNHKGKNQKKNYYEKVAQLYYFDSIGKTNNMERIVSMRTAMIELSCELRNIAGKLKTMPFYLFLILPEDAITIRDFGRDYLKYYDRLDRFIYDQSIPFNTINEFSWYIFEVMHHGMTSKSYDALKGELNAFGISYDLFILLTAYINLPPAQKLRAESTLLLNYTHLKLRKELLEFVNKHPIFSHIYFNTKLTDSSKPQLYEKVMEAYKHLMYKRKSGGDIPSDDKNNGQLIMQNLQQNGRHFKDLVNVVNVLDLFFNKYQDQMSLLYMEQFRSNFQFFKEMWNPYFNEIVNLRILEYFRRMFQKSNMDRSFGRFLKLWRIIGMMIRRLKSEIGKAFKRGMKTPEEPKTESDPTSASE